MFLSFAKNQGLWKRKSLPRTEKRNRNYKNPDDDPRARGCQATRTRKEPYSEGSYTIKTPSGREIDGPPNGTYWRVSKDELRELDADGRIWWGADGDNVADVKRFLRK